MRIDVEDKDIIVIDEGNIVVSKDFTGRYILGWGNPTDSEPDEPMCDYYPYSDVCTRNLSINESVDRALNRVYHEIWQHFSPNDIGDINVLREAIRAMIVNQVGRHEVYKLAGGIKKGVSQYNLYGGVPLGFVMKGYVDGYIQSPVVV